MFRNRLHTNPEHRPVINLCQALENEKGQNKNNNVFIMMMPEATHFMLPRTETRSRRPLPVERRKTEFKLLLRSSTVRTTAKPQVRPGWWKTMAWFVCRRHPISGNEPFTHREENFSEGTGTSASDN